MRGTGPLEAGRTCMEMFSGAVHFSYSNPLVEMKGVNSVVTIDTKGLFNTPFLQLKYILRRFAVNAQMRAKCNVTAKDNLYISINSK